jgi:Formate/nitrite family of transporters
MYTADEVKDILIEAGVKKVTKTLEQKIILGFLGGAMVALGYLAYVRIVATTMDQYGGLSSFLGACVFPIGLIFILLIGGELITSNMTVVALAYFAKKVTLKELINNWVFISIMNTFGAIFVAYVFGHLAGFTSHGAYAHETFLITQAKLAATPLQAFLSGIGCNWFVGLAVWLCFSAKDLTGKIIGIWFPVMVFVAVGFQHSIANLFVIPAAIFENHATWRQLAINVIPVYIGNVFGGVVCVALLYYRNFRKH